MRRRSLALPAAFAAMLSTSARAQTPAEWPAYGRDAGGSRFSPLTDVTAANVATLRPAWVIRTGDMLHQKGRFEATPLFVDGTLYLSTPLGRVLALDPLTGAEKWSYDPHISLRGDYGDFASRGVSTWLDTRRAAGEPCRRRVFGVTVDARMFALDAATGRLCDDFGDHGTIDLTRGLRNSPAYHGEYGVTSPPAVVRGLVIVGSAVSDNQRTNAPDGTVRAFDARTGARRWAWDPIPRPPAPHGAAAWEGRSADSTGAANAWSVLSADSARDLVFIPVGSASPDFYGGERRGTDAFANSVVALQASTGRVVWSFQVVHHDLWDYDVPAQPVLFTLHRNGVAIPALAQQTKMGHLFILDRRSGRLLFPAEERPVPASDVPGEQAAPTQLFPSPALRLVPESLTAGDAFGLTPESRERCRARIASLRSEGIFTPPSLRGTIVYPGNLGGGNWSAVAVDEARGLLVTALNHLPFVITLVPRAEMSAAHRAHPNLELGRQNGTPYAMLREVLLAPEGVPCSPPPWGVLTAVDLSSGTVKWSVPLGYLPGLVARDSSARAWGSVNIGGTLLTAGGLAFSAGTWDHHLRAFDVETGRELWSAELPAGGYAMPMTYEAGGRQFVLICAGGHDRLESNRPTGDWVVAYALPGPGAPTPDTATYEAPGRWAGELRVEDERDPTVIQMRVQGDSVVASLELGEAYDTIVAGSLTRTRITGTLSGRPTRNQLTLVGPFTFPAKNNCGGTLTLRGELTNGGRLYVGELEIRGTCSDGGHEMGGFSLGR